MDKVKSKKIGAIEEIWKLHSLGGNITKIERILKNEEPGSYYRIEKKDFQKYANMLNDSILSFSFSTPKIKACDFKGRSRGDLCPSEIKKVAAPEVCSMTPGVFYEEK